MDNQITEIVQQIQSEITISADGRGFISAKGAARLVGLSGVSLLGVNRFPAKLAETFTQQGVDPVNRPYSDIALTLIAEYYAYHAQRTTEQAKQVYRTLAAIGTRTWMQKVKGWAPEPVQPPQPALPPSDVRVANLVGALETLGFELDNPRFNQPLKALVGDILGLTPDQPLLEGKEDRWCGVAERAEELGYSPKLVTGKRSLLGKWVKKHYPGEPRQEKRLCNGTQRVVNLYLVGPDLDSCIDEYFKGHLKH